MQDDDRASNMIYVIRKQHYPDAWGNKPLAFAIYVRRRLRLVFLGYSWSREGAERALKEIMQ